MTTYEMIMNSEFDPLLRLDGWRDGGGPVFGPAFFEALRWDFLDEQIGGWE